MKKIGKNLWPVLFIIVIVMMMNRIIGAYDKEEAASAFGKVYSVKSNWTIRNGQGDEIVGNVPYRAPASIASSLTLTHAMSEKYSGLAMSMEINNATAQVFVGDMPIYGRGKKKPDTKQAASAVELQEETQQTATGKQEEGRIVISIPEEVKNGTIRIVLSQVDKHRAVTISGITIAKRDVAVIHSIQNSAFSMVCSIMIGIAIAVILFLDLTQMITKQKVRIGGYIVIMGLATMIYELSGMDVLFLMMGNEWMLENVRILAYAVTAPCLILFYRKDIEPFFPKRYLSQLYGTLAFMLFTVLLEFVGALQYSGYYVRLLVLVRMISFVLLFMMLVHLRLRGKRPYIWWEIVGFALLLASDAISIFQWKNGENGITIALQAMMQTAFFLFLAGQQVAIMVQLNRRTAKQREAVLEEKNVKLEAAKQEALLANEAKGKFLANMSHEIRTPINAVLGMDEMILRESKEKNIRGYAMDIFTSGQMLLSLINDILDFSKIESGKMEIVPVEYDVSSMIHDLVNMISVRTQAKNLELVVSVQEDLASRLYGDDVRIRQVLTNILTNAAKYTNEGTVWFRVSGHREDLEQILHFEVEDTGIGIKEEDLPKLFEDFARIEEARNRNIEGTGLGMNITLELLALMGSRPEVKSVYGKGSMFSFDLRQQIVDETPIGDFEARVKAAAEEYSYTESFIAPEAKVLVVDDNATNRRVFLSLLKATQMQFEEAAGGKEAIEKAKAKRYDIIFMDHMMPEVDGVEAMKAIRADEEALSRDTKIYVLTANAVTGAKEKYLAEGFDGFVSKPIVSRKLEEAIRNALPDELLLPAPEEEITDSEQGSVMPEFPMVDGVDWEIAWMHLQEETLLRDTLHDFYEMLPVHGEKLNAMYQRFPEEDAVKEYRILVHAMKGLAAMLGIIPLAGLAKVLEYAARDQELETIHSIHAVFLKEWYAYKEKLHGVFGIGEEVEAKKPPYEREKVKAYFALLRQALEEMDVDEADALMEKLLAYDYPEELLSQIKALHQAVTGLSEDAAGAIMDALSAKL
ncbi:Signal transduction histidine kinase [Lachnospiraceae bacterium XBB1006]|nr:Signal transduction histidine kinase [Lachnospiraceae bacterium XBB1006]